MHPLSRKNKINLTDYSYKRDIENRLLLSQLSVFEVDVLKEILDHSLKIPITSLYEALDVKSEPLIKALDKLSATRLFKREGSYIVVDKELRKYYESQIEKFDEDFLPDMEFLQGLLSRVPIHILPSWYSIPRSSDNIFASIIEKYLLTPKIYRQHLEELEFEDTTIHKIIEDLYQAPGFQLPSSVLIEKYRLTKEKFEEYLLLLEYHFVCCISYIQVEDRWEEIVRPFHEWHEYLLFESKGNPKPIAPTDSVQPQMNSLEFGFILEMQKLLHACQLAPMPSSKIAEAPFHQSVLFKASQVEWIENTKSGFKLTEKGKEWLKLPLREQSFALAFEPLNQLKDFVNDSRLLTTRNYHLIEKTLKPLTPYAWIDLEEFLAGMMATIGEKDPIALKNKGKRWRYELPTYTEEERHFIKCVIMERFFELGIVAIGTRQGKACFCLTPFGRIVLH